jgi:periplasmic protein TonB
MFMSLALGTFRYMCALLLGLVFIALLFTALWSATAATFDFDSQAVVATRIEFTRLRRDVQTAAHRENEKPQAELSDVPAVPQLEVTPATVVPDTLPWMTPEIVLHDVRAAFNGMGSVLDYTSGYTPAHESDVIAMLRIPPSYPRPAKLARIQGYVTMEVGISPEGTVTEVSVVDTAPPRMFDVAAMDAMKRWKFRPKIVNGIAVSQRAHQTIEFKIEED